MRPDFDDWRSNLRCSNPLTTENRSAQVAQDDHQIRANYDAMMNRSHKHPRADDHPRYPTPQDVRAASPNPSSSHSTPVNKYPCANCSADHKTIDCDSLTCSGHISYLLPPYARRTTTAEAASKRTRFNLPPHAPRPSNTPPTSPFLSRSARTGDDEYATSPYDSGYDSTASGLGHRRPG